MSLARHLLASDFDGTMADTFIPSPNGITVGNTYDWVIKDLFGEMGSVVYEAVGGLGNREPRELIDLLIATSKEMGVRIKNRDADAHDLTELLVEEKLKILVPEISPEWPILLPGFEHLITNILPDLGIGLAIVSSGHDEFIRRVFDVHDLNQPDVLVTSDTLRELGKTGVHKPHPYGLKLAKEQFSHAMGEHPISNFYIGDSDEKDGGMARNAGVPFGLIDPSINGNLEFDNVAREIRFGNFEHFGSLLLSRRKGFVEGRGFVALFDGGSTVEGQMPSGRERR